MGRTSYAIALGSNRRHGRHGAPAAVVAAAMQALSAAGLDVTARSAIRATPAMGGAGRGFANAAVLVETHLEPIPLLGLLKAIERDFGRRRGKRWGPRVLDLDMLLRFGRRRDPGPRRGAPILPHPGLASRDFVLQPLQDIAPGWRHPPTGHSVRQLRARLHRAKPVDGRRPAPLRETATGL